MYNVQYGIRISGSWGNNMDLLNKGSLQESNPFLKSWFSQKQTSETPGKDQKVKW